MIIENDWFIDEFNCKCPYCNKVFSKKGIATHILRKHLVKNINWGHHQKGKKSWRKGLNKNIDLRIKKNGENVSKTILKQIEDGIYKKRGWANWTDEKRKQQSIKMSQNNPGGKCKWFEINGIKVQGTWERDFALKMNEFSIKWTRCKPFIYKKDNKEKRYSPDFYIPEYDLFIEIKGFWWKNDKEKMNLVLEQNEFLKDKIKVVEKDLYQQIILMNKNDFTKWVLS